ncbi:large subunit GTPase 1 [Angomonas deanei]|uniref:Ferrous iron transport protein B/50S ribosome-binding GTPase, putative n=1 Tax=Angomonas deanei TaxID=59799 RepID=A0A7G2CVQ6_9TRYP|nr:large subunit GTPase 1 [Angomonas deanei]CAD2222503.1 Ferrous iron transport protein B/50S ribosome-binding GTPase, putative [Angomonas deanei]|eukprot:EPY38920.1 large subunit GTPase 1 [Angomonas deanei]
MEGEEEKETKPVAKKEKTRHKKKTLRAPVEVTNAYELADMRKQLKKKEAEPKAPRQIPLTEMEVARDERTSAPQPIEPWAALNAIQLLDQLALLRKEMGVTDQDTPIMVGLVGFPNVGKSSTINAILEAKKVVVSATPGKTKHFQTLTIPDERRVMLCDCPGLVFPSFASTKQQMVVDGILPIDNATDVLNACEVVGRRIPRQLLEEMLNVSLLPEDDIDESVSLAERLLNQLARKRGFMASHDRPNRARAGKELLKAYLEGGFVFVEPPPSYNPSEEELAVEDVNGSADEEEFEDLDSEEESAWADLEEADDYRALSEGGQSSEDSFFDPNDVRPFFYIRPRGLRNCYTRRELFNSEANILRMTTEKVERRRRKKVNQQLEPDMYTFINRRGEVELRIDDDDGIVALDERAPGPARPTLPKEKHMTKRQERRMMKKAGAGPINPSAKRYGIQDY